MTTTSEASQTLLNLRINYHALRPSEKRIADYILGNPNHAMMMDISSLAKACDTSEASVTRMCKAVGYNGYQCMKKSFVADKVESDTHKYAHIHEDVTMEDSTAAVIKKVMATNIKAIEDTIRVLNPSAVSAAVSAISKASRLEFYGFGGSGCVAMDAHHKFFKYGLHCAYYVDSHMQAMSAATMQPGDVVVAISNSGLTAELLHSVEVASEAGATTICITGSLQSELAKTCDIALIATADERKYKPEPMSARIAQLSVIDVLSVAVAMTRQESIFETLQKTRKVVQKDNYYALNEEEPKEP